MLVPLLAGILWIGLYPKPFLDRMEPSAQRFIQQARPAAAIPTATVGR